MATAVEAKAEDVAVRPGNGGVRGLTLVAVPVSCATSTEENPPEVSAKAKRVTFSDTAWSWNS